MYSRRPQALRHSGNAPTLARINRTAGCSNLPANRRCGHRPLRFRHCASDARRRRRCHRRARRSATGAARRHHPIVRGSTRRSSASASDVPVPTSAIPAHEPEGVAGLRDDRQSIRRGRPHNLVSVLPLGQAAVLLPSREIRQHHTQGHRQVPGADEQHRLVPVGEETSTRRFCGPHSVRTSRRTASSAFVQGPRFGRCVLVRHGLRRPNDGICRPRPSHGHSSKPRARARRERGARGEARR